jgi:hypothetical protein
MPLATSKTHPKGTKVTLRQDCLLGQPCTNTVVDSWPLSGFVKIECEDQNKKLQVPSSCIEEIEPIPQPSVIESGDIRTRQYSADSPSTDYEANFNTRSSKQGGGRRRKNKRKTKTLKKKRKRKASIFFS